MISKNSSKYIYVLSESPKRVGDLKTLDYHHHCSRILGWLNEFLVNEFPESIIVVKRGGMIVRLLLLIFGCCCCCCCCCCFSYL